MVAKVFFHGDGLKDGCFLELLDAFSINVIPWMKYRLGSFLCSTHTTNWSIYIYITQVKINIEKSWICNLKVSFSSFYLKELRNYVSHIIPVWSSFFTMLVYISVHFLPIIWKNAYNYHWVKIVQMRSFFWPIFSQI